MTVKRYAAYKLLVNAIKIVGHRLDDRPREELLDAGEALLLTQGTRNRTARDDQIDSARETLTELVEAGHLTSDQGAWVWGHLLRCGPPQQVGAAQRTRRPSFVTAG